MDEYNPKEDEQLQSDLAELDAAGEVDKEKSFFQQGREFNQGVRKWMGDLPKNVTVGLIDAAVNTVDFFEDVGAAADKNVERKEQAAVAAGAAPLRTPQQKRELAANDPGSLFDDHLRGPLMQFRNYLAQGSNTADKMTQAVAQFALPATVWTKALGGIQGVSKLRAAGNVIAGESVAAASALVPEEGRVADLLDMSLTLEGRLGDTMRTLAPDGSLANAYIDYVSSRDGDSEAEGRFKNVVDNLVTTAAFAGVLKTGAVAIRAGRRALTAAPAPTMIEPGAPAVADPTGTLPMGDVAAPGAGGAVVDEATAQTRARLDELLAGAAKRQAMEGQGQQILDDLVEQNVTPTSVGEDFWKNTYPLLNEGGKKRFQRYAQSLGFAPGDTLAVNADGSTVVAKTWEEVGEFISKDLAQSADQLEGTERGFVSLMKWANDGRAAAETGGDVGKLAAAPEGWDVVGDEVTLIPDGLFKRDDPMFQPGNEKRSNTTLWLNRIKAEVRQGNGLYQPGDIVEVEKLISKLESELAEIPVVYNKGDKQAVAVFRYSKDGVKTRRGLSDGSVMADDGSVAADKTVRPDDIALNEKFFDAPPERQIHALLHEMSHAVSVRKIKNATEEQKKQLHAIRYHTRENIKTDPALQLTDQYGLINDDELYAEAWSNLKFREALKATKLPEGGTAWDSFLSVTAKLLGISSLALMANIIEQGNDGEGA